MIKPEDLRKEYIIMNIIKIIDTILKTELDLDLHIITYNILPISEKFGFELFAWVLEEQLQWKLFVQKLDRHLMQ